MPNSSVSRQSSAALPSNSSPSRQSSAALPPITRKATVYFSYHKRSAAACLIAKKISSFLEDTGRVTPWTIEVDRYGCSTFDKKSEGISSSELVIIVYDDQYQRFIDCQQEAVLAADHRKKIMFVQAQRADFKCEDWLYSLKGGRVHVDFHKAESENDALNQIRNEAFQLLGLVEIRRPPSVTLEKRKFLTANVSKPRWYYPRKNYEENLLLAVEKICQCPEEGALVVAGDGGVGKTTLVEYVITDERNHAFLLNQCRIRVAVWLNCFEWQSSRQFGLKQQRSFISALFSKIKARFPVSVKFKRLSQYLTYFKEHHADHVFIVLDDVFNPNLVHFARQKFSDVPMCILTRDPVILTGELYQPVPLAADVLRVKEMEENEINEMLQKTFLLNEEFTSKQIQALAQRCCGLPLIASIMAANLTSISEQEYNTFMASDFGKLDVVGPHGNLLRLFEFSLSKINKKLRLAYYSFLIFDPAEPVSNEDLGVLWGDDSFNKAPTERLCLLLEERSLVRKVVKKSENQEHAWLIHQMLHEAAAKMAAETYGISTEEPGFLTKVRLMILTGSMVFQKSLSERDRTLRRLSRGVRKKRLSLMTRIVEKLDAVDLAQLCRLKNGDTDGMAFLHFVYNINWSDRRNSFFGASMSYRLVREIIFKLREFKVDFISIVMEERDPATQSPSNHKSLMQQVFADKEIWKYKPDRNCLIELLGQSLKAINEEQKWEETFCGNDAFRKFLRLILTSGDEKEIEAFFSSAEGKTLSRNDQGELMMCAARKGNLEAVAKLSELFPNVGKLRNRKGCTAIMFAASNNHIAVVKYLCEKYYGAASATDNAGWTPLMHATHSGNLSILKFLLRLTEPKVDMTRPLLLSATNGYLNIVEYICDNYPESASLQDSKNGMTPLMCAARSGHFCIVEFLHAIAPSTVVLLDKGKWTALMFATSGGHIDAVEFLYEVYRDALHIADNNGMTPLMVAARFGHIDAVDFFYEREPSAGLAVDKDGRTALMHAAASGHLAVVENITIHEKHFRESQKANLTNSIDVGRLSRADKLLVDTFD